MKSYRVTEVLLGLLSVLWAVWIVVFNTYETSNSLAPLRAWGIPGWLPLMWTLGFGMALLFAPRAWRRLVHLLMCSFWIFISLSLVSVNPALTGVPTYAIVGLIHACKYIFADKRI